MALPEITLELCDGAGNGDGWLQGDEYDFSNDKWIPSKYYFRFSQGPSSARVNNGNVHFVGPVSTKLHFIIKLDASNSNDSISNVIVVSVGSDFDTTAQGNGKWQIKEKKTDWIIPAEYIVMVELDGYAVPIKCHPMMRNARIVVNKLEKTSEKKA